MRTNLLLVVGMLLAGTGIARADLVDEFDGFDAVWETGVSGLQSSYYSDTKDGLPLTGATTGAFLPSLGPARISYPNGVGEVPSPGGSDGKHFDQGVLGIRIDGQQLVVRLASGLDPRAGYYYDGWHTWYGQGDLFITAADAAGIGHYALLTSWARDASNQPIELNGGHFNAAQAFHLGGGANGNSLEGHLVQLNADGDITVTGGTGAYNSGNAPVGLDMRAYAQGGVDLGNAGLMYGSVADLDQMWYLQTWIVDLQDLSAAGSFDISLHAVSSCGNDQIGGTYTVPEPGSLALLLGGAALFYRFRRLG